MMEQKPPELLIRDRDGCYGHGQLKKMLKNRGIKEVKTPFRSPMANSFVERQIGSIRRECTDHFLFLTEAQLQKTLNEFRTYHNLARPHQGIEQRIPSRSTANPIVDISDVWIESRPAVFGLHRNYAVVG